MEVFLNSKQYQQKQLNDTMEIDISGDFVHIPKNKMLSIRRCEPKNISNRPVNEKQSNSFWSLKKKYEKQNQINLSSQSRIWELTQGKEIKVSNKNLGSRRNKESVILEYKSSKILKPESRSANDSMEAIELITEIKRQKTITLKNNRKMESIGGINLRNPETRAGAQKKCHQEAEIRQQIVPDSGQSPNQRTQFTKINANFTEKPEIQPIHSELGAARESPFRLHPGRRQPTQFFSLRKHGQALRNFEQTETVQTTLHRVHFTRTRGEPIRYAPHSSGADRCGAQLLRLYYQQQLQVDQPGREDPGQTLRTGSEGDPRFCELFR